MSKKADLIRKARMEFPAAAKRHAEETTTRIQKETKAEFLKRVDALLIAGFRNVSAKVDREAATFENGVTSGPHGEAPREPQTSFSSDTGHLHSYDAFQYIHVKDGAATMHHEMQDVSVPYEDVRALPGFRAVLKYGEDLGAATEIGLKLQVYAGMDDEMRSEYTYPTKDLEDCYRGEAEGHVIGIVVTVDIEKPFDPARYPKTLKGPSPEVAAENNDSMALEEPIQTLKPLRFKDKPPVSTRSRKGPPR